MNISRKFCQKIVISRSSSPGAPGYSFCLKCIVQPSQQRYGKRYEASGKSGSCFDDLGPADVYGVAWPPDGKHLLSASIDGTVQIWQAG